MTPEMNGRKLTKKEIIEIAHSAEGKTFGQLGLTRRPGALGNKGVYGNLVEKEIFNILANSDPNPDFDEARIELKLTPIKKIKKGLISAKERCSLNTINYFEEVEKTFETSSFWLKNQNLLFMFYEWLQEVPEENFEIVKSLLFDYPPEDLAIIKHDWEIIVGKIRAGKAEEISEADTMYLGASPKGANSETLRKQPFSNVLAMQRAFCFKNSYMTQIVRKYVTGISTESLVGLSEMKGLTFEQVLQHRLAPYIGKSKNQLCQLFGVSTKAKNINEILFGKMLGISGKVSKSDEFLKANIEPKTIQIDEDGKIKQSMSFPSFDFCKIVNERWEDSDLRRRFAETKYAFIVFKGKKENPIFEGFFFWNMPLTDLDTHVYSVWKETVSVLNSGRIFAGYDKKGRRKNNFPGMAFDSVAHVRPHATTVRVVCELPKADLVTGALKYTRQCFWLNNTYIEKIISTRGH